MRIVRNEEELLPQFRSARSEAAKAFGIDDIFIEKYLEIQSTSRYRFWGTRKAISFISMSATAPFRDGIRK